MEGEKFRVFAFSETKAGRLQTLHIHHNPIREEQDGEIGILQQVEIESEIPDEHHFRFPIINLTSSATKEVIKSDYKDEGFENEVTRSMIYNHDKLINKVGAVSDNEKENEDDEQFKDRDLVVVRKEQQVPQTDKLADNAIDATDTDQASDRDIKATAIVANRAANRNTNKQVLVKKPHHNQVKAVHKETDRITRTGRIKYKTRKVQPLLVRDTVRYHTRVIDREEMELYNEETLAIEKIVDQENTEDVINKGPKQDTEIKMDENGGRKDEKKDKDQTAEGGYKEMEVMKTTGQKEFGFHLYGKKNFEGHYISRIEAGSGAERAGLRVGDRIITIGGKPSDELKHGEMVDLIMNSSGTLKMTVRNEIHMLRRAKVSLQSLDNALEKKLDFSNMDNARPKKKQAPKSQSWKEKKRMFQNL